MNVNKKKGHPKVAQNHTYQHTNNSAISQRARLVEALQEHGSITTIEARRDLDIMMPATRIFELREQGFKIDTVWTNGATDQGKQHRVARYVWRAAT
ncbi:helix-turn-helix domain-containing protein [Methylobacillus gramineus]|uniref:helix-turn-helix domain-containing protein n=1 Tax=Methylobacillus gramineus TaxID=755169 RepID=UPI001CFFFF46|nr:helix-turn-helix domain-containing protein [Methylobacillus gramineus]MCB5184010.1 helix-turn-helix domain-containing protein [Methylobacillus gramineus]